MEIVHECIELRGAANAAGVLCSASYCGIVELKKRQGASWLLAGPVCGTRFWNALRMRVKPSVKFDVNHACMMRLL